VLSLQADPRSPEQGQYGFLQDLVRRVAYETLSKRERAGRHLAAADHVAAALGEDEGAEVVAAHLLDAYQATPNEELKARAGGALTRAGERAAALAAAAEAQRYFEQAAELTDDPLARAELSGRAGEMAWRASKPAEARALLGQAEDAFTARGDVRAAARTAAVLAEIDFWEGGPHAAVERLEPAVAELEAGEEDADLAAAAGQLGRFLVLSGEYERAAPYVERALKLAEELELPDTLAQALNTKSIPLIRSGRPYEARLLLEGSLELALDGDLHAAALRAYNNLQVLLWTVDRMRDSLEVNDRAVELARRVGDRGLETQHLAASVGTLIDLGEWDEALARATELAEHVETEFAQSFLLAAVYVHSARGFPEEGRRMLARFDVVGRSTNPDHVGWWAVAQCWALRAEGRPHEALAEAERALAVYAESGAGPFGEALIASLEVASAIGDEALRAQLARFDGLPPGQVTPLLRGYQARFRAHLEPTEASALFETAARLLSQRPFHVAIVRLEHAEHLLAEGRPDDAEPLLAEASATFERLRATPWLERAAAAARTQHPQALV
jgi:tetratricopeptide (TPR) repeat protein